METRQYLTRQNARQRGLGIESSYGESRPGQQLKMEKAAVNGGLGARELHYSVDSISNPQASRRGSGMNFEFLFRRAHSRRRVERMY